MKSNANCKTPHPTPKARVMWAMPNHKGVLYPHRDRVSPIPCLVRPYPTKQQAQGAKRWAKLSYVAKVQLLAKAELPYCGKNHVYCMGEEQARAILQLLGETEGEAK